MWRDDKAGARRTRMHARSTRSYGSFVSTWWGRGRGIHVKAPPTLSFRMYVFDLFYRHLPLNPTIAYLRHVQTPEKRATHISRVYNERLVSDKTLCTCFFLRDWTEKKNQAGGGNTCRKIFGSAPLIAVVSSCARSNARLAPWPFHGIAVEQTRIG